MVDYNLAFDAQFSEHIPSALGDPRRIRFDKYHLFGFEKAEENLEIGRVAYSSEWERSGPIQNELISAAAINAGFGDHSARLRNAYAKFVADLFELKEKDGTIIYVEPGAGASTVVLFDELVKRGFDLEKLKSYLIEPAKDRIQIAVEQLESLGLEGGKHFIPLIGRNYDIKDIFEPGTVDVIGSLATDHHEPDQTYPREIEFDALKPGGFKVNFDWCPPTCYHPQPIYQWIFFNDELDGLVGDRWPTKKQDREVFEKLLPSCLENPPKMSPRDEQALKEIMKYWTIGYVDSKIKLVKEGKMKWKGDPNDIFLMEAHSTTEDVMNVYEKVGFQLETKDIRNLCERSGIKSLPNYPIEDSGILVEMAFQKPNE